MPSELTRRTFLGTAGTLAAVAGTATAAETVAAGPGAKPIKVIGIGCSLRKGKTTAAAVQICLDAIHAADPGIEVELIELASLSLPAQVAAGVPLEPGQKDDFPTLIPKLNDPQVAGIVIGTPVYIGNMSSLCKALLERCMAFRKNNFALANKVAGVIAVGGGRNGGQEQTIRSVHTALMSQQMILVGDAPPTAHWGGAVWNNKDDISGDEIGLATVKNLGKRVAEIARRMTK